MKDTRFGPSKSTCVRRLARRHRDNQDRIWRGWLPVLRMRAATILSLARRSLELAALRTLSAVAAGGAPGPASSLLKILGTEIARKISEPGSEATGYYALPWQPGCLDGTSNEEPAGPEHAGPAANAYLWRRWMSIYGGSNEIQRNIIAKQMLGLSGG